METEQPYFVVEGEPTGEKFYLNKGTAWTIGRSAENTFVFDDHSMSRRHALVQQMRPGKFYFIDLGSRNGSRLNGRRVTTALKLNDGDLVHCGDTFLVFHIPRVESQPSEAASEEVGETVVLYRRRLMTVLVIDIRDFTSLAQQVDEGLLAQSIGAWFRELGSIFQRSGCATEKYIGDAAMAVWVHESRIPDRGQILQVLASLLEAYRFTTGLHEQFSLPSPVRIGAGINTGLSVIGNSGPQESPDFSPLGESVNAAFRLESSTKNSGYDVALGRLSFECLAGVPSVEGHFEKRMVQLKGYEYCTEVWLTSYSKLSELLSNVPSEYS